MKKNTTSIGATMILAIIAGSMWFYHYWVDFAIVSSLNLDTSFIIFHLITVPLGALFYLFVLRRRKLWSVTYQSAILVFTLMGLSFLFSVLTIPGIDRSFATSIVLFLMLCVGFFVGITTTTIELLIIYAIHKTETRGIVNGIGYMFVGLITISALLLSISWIGGVPIFYVVIICVVLFIAKYTPKEETDQFPPHNTISIRHIVQNKETLPAYIASLFTGFFFTGTYYAIQAFLSSQIFWITNDAQAILAFGIFIPMILISFPAGILLDRFGRKGLIIIGANLQGLALVLLMILPESLLSPEFVRYIIFPILSLGVLYSVFLAIVYLSELGPEFGRRIFQSIMVILFGIGMTLGIVMTDVLMTSAQETSAQFLSLPIVILFLYFTYTLVIAQLRETLPDKAEREWKKQIHEVLVLVQGGLPLLQYSFEQGRIKVDSMLTSGALSGIDDLLSEITKQNERLMVIKQQNFSILMEHSGIVTAALLADEDLPILRERLQLFLAEFMAFFGDLVEDWTGEPVVFSPAKRLVRKLFSDEYT